MMPLENIKSGSSSQFRQLTTSKDADLYRRRLAVPFLFFIFFSTGAVKMFWPGA